MTVSRGVVSEQQSSMGFKDIRLAGRWFDCGPRRPIPSASCTVGRGRHVASAIEGRLPFPLRQVTAIGIPFALLEGDIWVNQA